MAQLGFQLCLAVWGQTLSSGSAVLLLESGRLSSKKPSTHIICVGIMLPNEQKMYHFHWVIGTCPVIKMPIGIIKHLLERDELETSPLSVADMKTVETIC